MDQLDINAEVKTLRAQVNMQGKLLRWSFMGWIGFLSLFALGAAYKSETFFEDIKVKRLALIDKNGVERLILVADSDTVRVGGKVYTRKPAVSGIIVNNTQGDEVGGFGSSDNGMTVLMLDSVSSHSPYGASERIGMISMPNGMAGLVLTDLSTKMRSCIYTDENMGTGFVFKAQDGSVRLVGQVAADGTTKFSDNGESVSELPAICAQ